MSKLCSCADKYSWYMTSAVVLLCDNWQVGREPLATAAWCAQGQQGSLLRIPLLLLWTVN
jgi:hypothetical protein